MKLVVAEQEPPFETMSYVGSDIAQFSGHGERPARSAKLVAAIDYDGCLLAKYWLSTTRERHGWLLWASSDDVDLGKKYARMAWGEPYRRVTAKRAAEALLRQVWLDEIRLFEYRGPCNSVDQEGLLTQADVRRIEASLSSDTESEIAAG